VRREQRRKGETGAEELSPGGPTAEGRYLHPAGKREANAKLPCPDGRGITPREITWGKRWVVRQKDTAGIEHRCLRKGGVCTDAVELQMVRVQGLVGVGGEQGEEKRKQNPQHTVS